jgi:hypothetical protein
MLGVYGSLSGISSGPGPAAASWSLAEKAKFAPSGKPSAQRIAEYFEPAMREGPKGRFKLNMEEGNWCAAGACFAAMQVVGSEDLEKAGLPHAYRVSGKELEEDSIKHGAWLPVADVLKGARPNAGDLAIYNRGAPQDWTRHVGRVLEVGANSYKCIDGNGVGAAWWLAEKLWTADNLRGFVRYPASLGSMSSRMGIVAGMLMIAAGAAFVWGVTRVKPGLRANPAQLQHYIHVYSSGPLMIVRIPWPRPLRAKLAKAYTGLMKEHGLLQKDISGLEGVTPWPGPRYASDWTNEDRVLAERLRAAFAGDTSVFKEFWLYDYQDERFQLVKSGEK